METKRRLCYNRTDIAIEYDVFIRSESRITDGKMVRGCEKGRF